MKLILQVFAASVFSVSFLGNETAFSAPKTQATKINCPSTLECYEMNLPLQYEAVHSKKTPVMFAVHPAKKQRKGALLFAFGGPGDSGISGLRDWLPTLDPALTDAYDLVTFDLRGTHRSGNMNCPVAYGDFIFVPARGTTAQDRNDLKAGSEYFAQACPEEMGVSADDLPYYNTQEAIQDVNAFRAAMGYTSWTIHAMSYGTQFSQHYATRYPEQVDALVLDGAVDMSVDLLSYESDLADAQNDVLNRSFKACEKDLNCASLFALPSNGTLSIGKIYDQIRAQLKRGPASVAIDDTSLNYTAYDFEFTAAGSIGRAAARTDFMRALALASGSKKDFSMLLRLANGEDINPAKIANLEKADTTFSGMSNGLFYAFICNDYGMSEVNPENRSQAFFDHAKSREAKIRIRNALYGELPCAYWSSTGSNVGSNKVHVDASIPTLVVNATGDANVPAKHGFAVAAQIEGSALVEVEGGKHIMYGYKIPCIDEPVTKFLLTHELPGDRHIKCTEALIAPVHPF